MDRLVLSLVAAPIVFSVCAFATRAPRRRVAAALAGGVAFAIGNAAVDVLARAAGWWSYPGVDAGYAPPHWYAAAGLAAAGASLIGWRVGLRFGSRGTWVFLVAFAVYCVLRDWRVARATNAVIVFAPGPVPLLADGGAAFALMVLALGVQRRASGPARSDPPRRAA